MPAADVRPSDQERVEIISTAAEWLLSTDDPAAVVGRIFAKASGPLALDYYFNFLADDAGDALWLHSCAGIPEPAARDLARLEFGQAVCGVVAQQRRPLVAGGIQASTDPAVAFIRGVGVEAYACFPLIARGKLIGTLSFGSRRRTSFTPGEVELLRSISHYVAIAQERRRSEQAVAAALAEREGLLQQKEMLLKEVNHRVKNSLQLVSSLLAIQGGRLKRPELRRHFLEASQRVHAIAAVHHRLYHSDNVASVPFGPYLRDLCGDLQKSMGQGSRARVITHAEDVEIATEKAVPLGLIVNELVTNAFKHAYPDGTAGDVRVTLDWHDVGVLRLAVADDGAGMPDGLDVQAATSLGMTIVRGLAAQLGGQLDLDRGHAGACFTVTVPL